MSSGTGSGEQQPAKDARGAAHASHRRRWNQDLEALTSNDPKQLKQDKIEGDDELEHPHEKE